jgi:predicted metalloprotease with PDZ domain
MKTTAPRLSTGLLLSLALFVSGTIAGKTAIHYTVTIPDPASSRYVVELSLTAASDSVTLRLPRWMPGYYQLMSYADNLRILTCTDNQGNTLKLDTLATNAWRLKGVKGKAVTLTYTVDARKQFVANSLVDKQHAYLVPAQSFLYEDGNLDRPAIVSVKLPEGWSSIATGLDTDPENPHRFSATSMDVLYDCPLLLGNLKSLPSFKINGIEHRFLGYDLQSFDGRALMTDLQRIVQAAVDLMGDIPYDTYTFIGIGPGNGGIEHLNNCVVSFTGQGLDTEEGRLRNLHFLAHEYFHHFNVKRIRPVELGPFDYDRENRTTQLWVSEGLTVYYESVLLLRAGLIDSATVLKTMEAAINALENNPGRHHQSLAQASYQTWEDGPFGNQGPRRGKTISYYAKGPVVGWLLDMRIRQASKGQYSLDEVMRHLYRASKATGRGFTDAEFQQTCEHYAGADMSDFFDYVYTTKPLDYTACLKGSGLRLDTLTAPTGKTTYTLTRL